VSPPRGKTTDHEPKECLILPADVVSKGNTSQGKDARLSQKKGSEKESSAAEEGLAEGRGRNLIREQSLLQRAGMAVEGKRRRKHVSAKKGTTCCRREKGTRREGG